METIVYFYGTKAECYKDGVQPYRLEKIRQERYCLIKVGLEYKWLEEARQTEERIMAETVRQKRKGLFHRRKGRPKNSMLCELLKTIYPLIDTFGEGYLVYEEKLKRMGFPGLWEKYCAYPEFEDYRQEAWSEPLLAQVRHPSYVILGFSYCLPEFLWQKGDQMKSLCWILPRKLYTREIQNMESAFYEEFGLAIDMRVIDSEEEYKRVRLESKLPVNVLDFSEEEKIQTADLPEGSIWLDMSSMEEKRRRIEERHTDIFYFSLKKHWKQIDTTNKNGYNT